MENKTALQRHTMKKQTAVEWLIEQLQAPCRGIPSHIVEQAIAMEKEQINQACYDGYYHEGMMDTRSYYDNTYVQNSQKKPCG
jgi:hypothetical protein